MEEKARLEARKQAIETAMMAADFWNDKTTAQAMIKELQEVKDAIEGVGMYDKGNAVMTIFAGAGGDDAEDFVRMLYTMYANYADTKGWKLYVMNENRNTMGGYRSITVEIHGSRVYGTLKGESGVHRLVRISPFNAKGKRNTSFAMVEVIPVFEKNDTLAIPKEDLKIDFAKSSGPGGQNVNKRETAVRIVHLPTNLAVHVDGERTQEANRDKAMSMIMAKLYVRKEAEEKARLEGTMISKTTDNEWGSQMRSYVLHPYQMVKDHITGVEVRNTDAVFAGDIEAFVVAHR